jgi:hypothetical protein
MTMTRKRGERRYDWLWAAGEPVFWVLVFAFACAFGQEFLPLFFMFLFFAVILLILFVLWWKERRASKIGRSERDAT